MTLSRPETVVHGGDLDGARESFPDAPEPWIDLSTGINPEPYPLPELAPAIWSRLPQAHEMRALIGAAARRYRAQSPEMVVAAPGTQALIGLLPRLMERTRVAILGPTYAEHAAAWQRQGHDVSEVRELASAQSANVVVVVNPNNPTGRVVAAGELARLAQVLHERGGLLVVDEAFADVMPGDVSLVPALPPSAIVLRSFGKTYGLAGLRLGFAIAHAGIARRLDDLLGPWAVSGPALAIGTAALADDGWLQRSRHNLERGCRRLDELLEACGCVHLGGTPLFRLATHPRAPAIAGIARAPRHSRAPVRGGARVAALRVARSGSRMAAPRAGIERSARAALNRRGRVLIQPSARATSRSSSVSVASMLAPRQSPVMPPSR